MTSAKTINFNETLNEITPRIEAYVRQRLGAAGSPSDVDEVVQQVLIRLWQIGDISDHPNQDALVFKIARGKTLNYLRDRRRTASVGETNCGGIGEDSLAWDDERTDCLDRAQELVAKLPPRLRSVMEQRLLGKSNRQIASALKLTEECVESRCSRAVKKMRERAGAIASLLTCCMMVA